jgi:hypothetical protein
MSRTISEAFRDNGHAAVAGSSLADLLNACDALRLNPADVSLTGTASVASASASRSADLIDNPSLADVVEAMSLTATPQLIISTLSDRQWHAGSPMGRRALLEWALNRADDPQVRAQHATSLAQVERANRSRDLT